MNSIAAPSRTDPAPRAGAIGPLRTALAATILSLLLVTFTPFQADSLESTDGNLVNQLGYGILGVTGILGHLLFTERGVALRLLRPAWLLMAAYLLYSATQALDPGRTLRTVLFSLMAMLAATEVVCLPPGARSFRTSFATAALVVMGLSYAGVALWPAAATHLAGGDEPQHAGLWRGIYAHKNLAAPVMAAFVFGGLYILRSGQRALGLLVMVLAGVFVLKTGSKTSSSLVPLVAVLVASARAFGGRRLPIAILSTAVAGMALLTFGTVLSEPLNRILQAILPGTTFTGRMDLWRFALDIMRPHQWTGYGLESFWLTENVFRTETPFELSWDPRGIVNGHNGYLDIAIAMGWPALLVAVPVLIVLPFRDYLHCRPEPENERLADAFLMILVFCLLNAFLESFFFQRGNPVWLLAWISIVGLRLLSKFDMRA